MRQPKRYTQSVRENHILIKQGSEKSRSQNGSLSSGIITATESLGFPIPFLHLKKREVLEFYHDAEDP